MRSFHFPSWRTRLPWLGVLAAALTVTLIAAIFFISIDRAQLQRAQARQVAQTVFRLEQVLLLLRDAQSGVRGFILSGEPDFLRPQEQADERIRSILATLQDNGVDGRPAEWAQELAALQASIEAALRHLRQAEQLRRGADGAQAAAAYIRAGHSEQALEQVRGQITRIEERQRQWLATHEATPALDPASMKRLIVLGTAFTFLLLGGAFWLLKREIRHRRRVEQALHKANQSLQRRASQLKTSNLELESFSYSISHDLRIPLRAVSGYARMLEEDHGARLDAEGRRLLQVILENGQRMGRLIDDLLAFSRLGRKELLALEIDMQELVESLVAQVRSEAGGAAPRFEIGTLAPASGDRALLQQVWTNLIANAVKYSARRAEPLIRIFAQAGADENVYAISDNGVGFDMQYYDKLFGVFQRLHRADEFPGSGVGLAIVQRIVTRHGGRVWAESEPDRGATFFFSLPLDGTAYG